MVSWSGVVPSGVSRGLVLVKGDPNSRAVATSVPRGLGGSLFRRPWRRDTQYR